MWFLVGRVAAVMGFGDWADCGIGWAKYLGISQKRRRITAATATAVAGAWLSGLFVVSRSGPVRGYLGRHYDHLYNVFFLRV